MITVYVPANAGLMPVAVTVNETLPVEALWIDLLQPSEEELTFVDLKLNLDVPTEADMQEIEVSSRLYVDNGTTYMTATMVTNADTPRPQVVPVTFVLAAERLLTLRYAEPTPFRHYAAEARRHAVPCGSGEEVLAGLLDAIVDRLADILERVQSDIDILSGEIFLPQGGKTKRDFDEILRRIGRSHALTSQVRESLVSFGRLVSFVDRPATEDRSKPTERAFKTIAHDLTALSDHASFIANNTSFILNATLGLINNEQSGIIKIFSVAAVVFLPPTLIASIYGMNFQFMPELGWPVGYPLALLLMVASAVGPYFFFKQRGWL